MTIQDLIDSLSDLEPNLLVLDEYGRPLSDIRHITEYDSKFTPTASYVQLAFGGTIVSEELF